MNKTEILVIGKDAVVLENVSTLLNEQNEWSGTPVITDEEAIEKFHHRHFDIVLFTKGVTEGEEKKLRKLFTHQNNTIILMQHNGAIDGLLLAAITEALNKQRKENKPTISFMDDALKNAGLNITVQ